jgi:hypothetical protein
MPITVRTPPEIDRLNSVVHDCFFDLGGISYDGSRAILTIPFKRTLQQPGLKGFIQIFRIRVGDAGKEWLLRIFHVVNFTVSDSEKVRYYDINELRYDGEHRRLTLATGIPLTFEVVVSDFELSLEETDRIIRYV